MAGKSTSGQARRFSRGRCKPPSLITQNLNSIPGAVAGENQLFKIGWPLLSTHHTTHMSPHPTPQNIQLK